MGIVRFADDVRIAQHFKCWDQVEIYQAVRVTDGWDWGFSRIPAWLSAVRFADCFDFATEPPAIKSLCQNSGPESAGVFRRVASSWV